MKGASRTTFIIIGATIQLLISGCGGGGGGGLFGSLFGGGSNAADLFASFASTGGDLFSGDFGLFSLGDGTGGDVGGGVVDTVGDVGGGVAGLSGVATVHHPEPGTMALFGGGMAGTAFLGRRRRKSSRRRS